MVVIPEIRLIDEDDIPMENIYHRYQQQILVESLAYYWRERDDYFVGANMFVYYSRRQAEKIVNGDTKEYRGPDFFVVLGVDFHKRRTCWVVWEEDGRYPDVILEILSPSTAQVDKTTKKELYANVFGTKEYFILDFDEKVLEGYELTRDGYEPMVPNEKGWLWSAKLGLWLGFWEGVYVGQEEVWLRFFTPEGELVLTAAEDAQQMYEQERLEAELARQRAEQERLRAEQERERAEQERLRAEQERERAEQERLRAEQERQAREQIEARLERLRQRLAQQGISLDELNGEA